MTEVMESRVPPARLRVLAVVAPGAVHGILRVTDARVPHRLPGESAVLTTLSLGMGWDPARPRVLVIACSDGRLQEATDAFLERALGVHHYDRLYAPGGAGALASSGCDFLRAQALRRECRFLVEAHHVEHLVLLLHGPAADGPPEALCADYRRKQPWARPAQVRAQQEADIRDLMERRSEFAGDAQVSAFRIEVTAAGKLSVATLHRDPALLAPDQPAAEASRTSNLSPTAARPAWLAKPERPKP